MQNGWINTDESIIVIIIMSILCTLHVEMMNLDTSYYEQ